MNARTVLLVAVVGIAAALVASALTAGLAGSTWTASGPSTGHHGPMAGGAPHHGPHGTWGGGGAVAWGGGHASGGFFLPWGGFALVLGGLAAALVLLFALQQRADAAATAER